MMIGKTSRVLALVLAFTLLPTTALAKWSTEDRIRLDAPTLEGSSGLFRTLSATMGTQWDIRVGVHAEYFRHKEFIVANFAGCDDSGTCPNEVNQRFMGAVTVGFTPWKYLEVYGTLFSSSNFNERNHQEVTQEPSVQMALGDWLLGIKGQYPVHKSLHLGLTLGVKFLNGYGDINADPSATNVYFAALLTFDIRKLAKKVPLRFHLNLGYLYDRSHKLLPEGSVPDAGASSERHHAFLVQQFALGLNKSRFRFSFGIDVPMPYWGGLINPIVEIQVDANTESADGTIEQWLEFQDTTKDYNVTGRVASRFTLGIRWRPVAGFYIDTGIDIAMSHQGFAMGPPLPPWNFFFSAGYVFGTKAKIKLKTVVKKETITKVIRPKPTTGQIRGTVKDGKTGVPVAAALITFPGKGLTDLATAEDGSFTTYKLKAGVVRLEVRHPKYKTWTGQAKVAVRKITHVDVVLVPKKPKIGSLVGTMTDKAGSPLGGNLELDGSEKKTVTVDSTGAFTVTLKPGAYRVKASSSGYFSRYNAFVIQAGGKASLEFKLTKKPKRARVVITKRKLRIRKKIHFAYNKTTIRPDSLQILDEVASVMQEHPEIKLIRVEGHTDRRGGYRKNLRLSQGRSEAVRDYLIAQGVDPSRLVARGYGYKRPLVPELTPRHRAINRRVEFRIMKRSK